MLVGLVCVCVCVHARCRSFAHNANVRYVSTYANDENTKNKINKYIYEKIISRYGELNSWDVFHMEIEFLCIILRCISRMHYFCIYIYKSFLFSLLFDKISKEFNASIKLITFQKFHRKLMMNRKKNNKKSISKIK